MKKQYTVLTEIYKIDESNNSYMIEVALNDYAEIFNKRDPAPFKRREIDPDLEIYLERSSHEIPFDQPIELCFVIAKGNQDKQIEEELIIGLENSFSFKIYLLKKQRSQIHRRIAYAIFIGFLLLGITTAYSKSSISFIPNILLQGLVITGWVFIWEAISLMFFSSRDFYYRYRTYKRLYNAPIIFQEYE
jgi:hypothetical protein